MKKKVGHDVTRCPILEVSVVGNKRGDVTHPSVNLSVG